MPGGKHVRERLAGLPGPFFVPRRHLGADDDATGAELGLQRCADQALTVSVPVRQGGIEERDPSIDGLAQGLTSSAVIAAAPLGAAQSPATEAELADDISRRAEDSSLHCRPPGVPRARARGQWRSLSSRSRSTSFTIAHVSRSQ